MKILYGPPGTGKTWRATREAVRATAPDLYNACKTDDELKKLHDNLVADGRILWVTFHPSYSYEDFVEGFRPTVSEDGQLAYKVVDGPFKMLCQRARLTADIPLGEILKDAAGRRAGEVVQKDSAGWVVRVTPNRSDEVAERIDKFVPRYVVSKILSKKLSPKIFSIPGKALVRLEDYGIDPDDKRLPKPDLKKGESRESRVGALVRKIAAADAEIFSSSDLANAAHIGAIVRRTLELQDTPQKSPTPVTLVIDEINRAETSRVFGDLLTLLEANKREGEMEEKHIWLPYSKEPFTIPPSVSIIGTMNTVDRSLTALDFAMRRRFEFVHTTTNPELVPVIYGNIPLRDFLRRVNNRLSLLLGSGHEFGHSFFMHQSLSASICSMSWQNLPDAESRSVAHILRLNIIPTLAEYFHNDQARINAVIGTTQINSKNISLFESNPVDDSAFIDRLDGDYELSNGKSLTYADWWDPSNENWNGEMFIEFTKALASGK